MTTQSSSEDRHHERSLLAQRLLIFLLANSILFLGFLQLDSSALTKVVPSVGIITCLVLTIQTERIRRKLDRLDQQLGNETPGWYVQPFRGRATGFWLAAVFLIIWGFSFFA